MTAVKERLSGQVESSGMLFMSSFINEKRRPRLRMPELNLLNNEKTDLYKYAIEIAIKTYPLEWRVILETLQNSIDAIDKNEKVKEGEINVIFNIGESSVTIQDNGIGFPLKEDLFFLHGGTKSGEVKSKGKIGVGLKVTMFSSKSFFINSVFKDDEGKIRQWSAEVTDAHKYLGKSALTANISNLQESKAATGTTMTYSFPDNSVTELIKTFGNKIDDIPDIVERSLTEKFLKSMEYFFRTNSYSADTCRLIDEKASKKIKIDVSIKYDEPPVGLNPKLATVFSESNGNIKHSFYNKYWDIEELIKKQKGMNKLKVIDHKLYEKSSEFGQFNPDNFMWIRRFTDKKEIKGLLPKKSKDAFDGLIKKINGIYLAIGTMKNMRKFYFRQPNKFISINGTPSDHNLPNPTSSTAYANVNFCIIDVDSVFNYGKLQTPDRYLISQCGKFYLEIYKNAIVKIGEKTVGTDIEEDTSAKSVDKPTLITDLSDLGIDSSFKKTPTDENALIALFFDLLGRGTIKDYEFYSLHAKRKYDATAMIKIAGMKAIPTPNNDSDLKTVEFKLRLSELIDEIEDRTKELKKMTLIIVWEDDAFDSKDKPEEYEIISIDESEDKGKEFYGVQKCLVNKLDGTQRQIFVMKDFIEKLKRIKN